MRPVPVASCLVTLGWCSRTYHWSQDASICQPLWSQLEYYSVAPCGRQLSAPECVDIQCIAFQLHSSQAVDRLQLNERVRFAVHTRFFCEGPPGAGADIWLAIWHFSRDCGVMWEVITLV